MIGEVVGKAASLCIKMDVTPRAIYERYFSELQELLRLPGAARRATVNETPKLPEGYVPPPLIGDKHDAPAGLPVKSLPGLALDDSQAKLTGKWAEGHGLPGFYGTGYRYRGPKEAGDARYEFTIEKAGIYEVRLSYSPHENRASKAPVTIESAEGRKTVTVNERVAAPLEKGFVSLGKFQFSPGKPAVVIVGDGPADGNVAIDVVQLLPSE
jgi:hypothetical protein